MRDRAAVLVCARATSLQMVSAHWPPGSPARMRLNLAQLTDAQQHRREEASRQKATAEQKVKPKCVSLTGEKGEEEDGKRK